MKKYLALLCATLLCACCLGLAACGGSPASSGAASSGSSESAESSSSSAAADPAAKFIGTWKLAAAEMDGVTIAGDLSAVLGDALDMQITIAESGTGMASFNGESVDLTWEATSDDALTLTIAADEESTEDLASALGSDADDTLELAYENGALVLAIDENDTSGKLFFTQSGTMEGAAVIDVAAGAPITDEADLVGDWKLAGMNMMGMSIYGDADTIASMASSTDMSLSLAAGGTGTLAGEEITYAVDASGASIEADGTALPLLALENGIVLDMTDRTGIEMVLFYTK